MVKDAGDDPDCTHGAEIVAEVMLRHEAGVALRRGDGVACVTKPGLGLEVGIWYWLGVAAVAALLTYEHVIVRPGDLRRLDAAFFTVNGVISIVFLGFVLLDVVVG